MARRLKPLDNLLKRPNGQIARIVGRVHQQQSLLEKIKRHLALELRPHCLHAEQRGGELQIFTDTPAWAQRVQYLSTQLCSQLNQGGDRKIRKVRVRVLPQSEPPSGGRRRSVSLSAENAELIAATAQSVSDPALRRSLTRLASRQRSSKRGDESS